MKEFAESLAEVDLLILAPVYAAGEEIIKDADSKTLALEIKKIKPNLPIFESKSMKQLLKIVKENSKSNDLLLSMGAGDINNIWNELILENHSDKCPKIQIAA